MQTMKNNNWKTKLTILLSVLSTVKGLRTSWRWQCNGGYCRKYRIDNFTYESALSLSACQLFCMDYAGIWPQPTGNVSVGNDLVRVNINTINITSVPSESLSAPVLRHALQRLKNQTERKGSTNAINGYGGSISFNFDIRNPNVFDPILNVNESYYLTVSQSTAGSLNVTVQANTVFGARHALETLGQLIIYDDIRDQILIPRDVKVTDAPSYTYRGLSLDTSRNFISVDTIKRNLDAMAASKLNRFHWHITDTQSFPFYSKSHPQLTSLGAYSPMKIYTTDQIADIVEYARVRGIKIIPEFDAPAHVGEGWQDTGFALCLDKQPWSLYCIEPPCGQLDPTNEKVYNFLGDIYSDMLEVFNPDMFHMGGDEVSFDCWKSESKILEWLKNKGWDSTNEEKNFIKLWNMFQTKALAQLDSRNNKTLPIILWTSTLTKAEYVQKILAKDRYIIQVWTIGSDNQITDLLDAGYKLILSNHDALYLDCGFGGWLNEMNNWCSPYIGWQKVYSNRPYDISNGRTNQILGSEATMWTEEVDDLSVDGRLWPRAAALAEILWSEPNSSWQKAKQRMLLHRERLVRDTGVNAEALEPEWCLQNENYCLLLNTNSVRSNKIFLVLVIFIMICIMVKSVKIYSSRNKHRLLNYTTRGLQRIRLITNRLWFRRNEN